MLVFAEGRSGLPRTTRLNAGPLGVWPLFGGDEGNPLHEIKEKAIANDARIGIPFGTINDPIYGIETP